MTVATPRKIGDVIAKRYRNHGYSLGLQHPYIWGKVSSRWLVWNRHSGKVCFATRRRPDENDDYFAEQRAGQRAELMNARRAGYKGGKLPVDIAAIDSTP